MTKRTRRTLYIIAAVTVLGLIGALTNDRPRAAGRHEVAKDTRATTGVQFPGPIRTAKRGTTAASYEGLYDAEGRYRFPGCSAFELEVARVVHRELYRRPGESEGRALRRAGLRVKLKPSVARDIYAKAVQQCGWTPTRVRS